MPILEFDVATPEQLDFQKNTIPADRKAALFGDDTWEDLDTFRLYARGQQKITLTDEQKLILKELLGNKFCDNVCHQIIAEARDRLIFRGWKCKAKKVAEALEQFRQKVNLEFRLSSIIYDTLRDGNHAVAVNWDFATEKVQIYREQWWNGVSGVFIAYDEADSPAYAVKEWITDEGKRRNVWFDDRLERWFSTGGVDWVPYVLPEDKGVWPQPWTKDRTPTGEPLHIPYVHFANNGLTFENYGISELAGGVIGFQDQINDLQLAMSGAGRLTAYQMITAAGIEEDEEDENGKPIPLEVGPGKVLRSTSSDTVFGYIPAGDLSQLLALFDKKVSRVCQMTRTPYHRISGGDWPSGEALLRSEQPAVGKAENQLKRLVVCMVQIGHKYTEIHNTFSKEPKIQEDIKKAPIESDFMAPERRDPLSKSVIVSNLGERISDKEALRIMEYSEAEVEQISLEKQEERQASVELANLAFSRGTGAGTDLPGRGPSSQESRSPARREEQEKQSS